MGSWFSTKESTTISNTVNLNYIKKLETDNFGYEIIPHFSRYNLNYNVIYQNNKFIGHIYSYSYESGNNFDQYINKILLHLNLSSIIYIPSFCIQKEYQNKGYGSILFNHHINTLKNSVKEGKEKNNYICLGVRCDNERAVKLYKKQNFIIFEKIDKLYKQTYDGYLMYRKLN